MSARELAETDLRSRIELDGAGRIAVDLRCRVCGYNQRGADPSGVCPECGRVIAPEEMLPYQDPRWLARFRWGAWLLLFAALVGLGLLLVAAASEAVEDPAWPQTVGATMRCEMPRRSEETFAGLGFVVLVVAGMHVLTTRGTGPGPREVDGPRRAARLATWCLGLCLLGTAVWSLLAPEPQGIMLPMTWSDLWLDLGFDLVGVLFLLAVVRYPVALLRLSFSRWARNYARVVFWCGIPVLSLAIGLAATRDVACVLTGPNRYPVAFVVSGGISQNGNWRKEYIVVDRAGTMTRTTTAPAESLPRPSPTADALLDLHQSLGGYAAALVGLWLLSAWVLLIVSSWAVHQALVERRRLGSLYAEG